MVANPKNKPKMTKFVQKYAQYAFRSKLKQKIATKFEEKAIRKTEICKKQATCKSSKKPATPQKKTSPNSRENRKIGNTAKNSSLSRQLTVLIMQDSVLRLCAQDYTTFMSQNLEYKMFTIR